MSEPVDNKAHIRHELDLTGAVWVRLEPKGANIPGAAEHAVVEHTDGATYVAMRQADDPSGPVLVFDDKEWDAFLKGIRDGELTLPEGYEPE